MEIKFEMYDKDDLFFNLDLTILRILSSEPAIYLKSDMRHPWGKEDILVYDAAGIIEVSENHNSSNEIIINISRIPDLLNHISISVSKACEKWMISNKEDAAIFAKHEIDPKEISKKYVGFYGFVSYTLGKYTERPSFTGIGSNPEEFPLLLMIFPKKYLIRTQKVQYLIEIHDPDNEIQAILSKYFPSTPTPQTHALNNENVNHARQQHIPSNQPKELRINNDFNEYIDKINQLKQHILNGDIYQANFTMQYSIPWPDYAVNESEAFLFMIKNHPAPYAAYLRFPHRDLSIFSFSPELFLEIRNGVVTTRPIKGTRSRGQNKEEDAQIIEELKNSEKENAELSMIVDLLRNDLARSSIPGSVEVREHAIVETFSNVFHLVSTVQSKTDNDLKSHWNLFLRAFPGGSITGCPKKRAMEIINELEQYSRELYTGSIGYFTIGGNLTMNIAIRTVYTDHNRITFNSGGGIVIDSDPISEYVECLHKAKHLAQSFGFDFVGHLAWHNGKIVSKHQLEKIPFYTALFESSQFIEGCFETILVDNGVPQNLASHYARLEKGLKYFKIEVGHASIPSYEQLLLLCKINIANVARLRLSCYRVKATGQIHCIAELFPFKLERFEIRLLLASKPFDPPKEVKEAGIKTLNYAEYKNSFDDAISKGFFAEILYDSENNILETARTNIYLKINGKWVTPKSNIIEGTYRARLIKEMAIEVRDIKVKEIKSAELIAVSNALIGFQSVAKIAKRRENSQEYEAYWLPR